MVHGSADRIRHRFGKSVWEFVNRGPDYPLRIFGKVLEDRTNQTRSDARDFCRLNEVTRKNFANGIVPTFADRHGELELLALDLVRVETWLCAQNIVKRRHSKPSARAQED